MKPAELQLGNFISVFGKAEMVMGLTPQDEGWFINHSACFQDDNPIGDGILFDPEPIPITEEWLYALRLEQYSFPDHIKYVHEAQNYSKWVYQATFQPNFDYITQLNTSYDTH